MTYVSGTTAARPDLAPRFNPQRSGALRSSDQNPPLPWDVPS
jgi:hypothetical protein